MPSTKGIVVVVDDDEDIRFALSMLLSNEGYQVLEANDPKQLARILAQQTPNLVLLDMNFSRDTTSGGEGLEVLELLTQQNIATVLMTAWGNIELAVKGMQLGAADFVEKPWDNQKLIELVDKHVFANPPSSQKRARNIPVKGSTKISAWIAQSPAMQALESMVEQVADTQASVLILGENGTGKSLLAERIHHLSSRHSAPLVSVNMGAIPESLFESELFGHVKGAFTDAKEARKGRFELAQNGTLFFDEIGALPNVVQPKLLRVLESNEFEPVGSSITHSANVRIISATNANLNGMVESGTFRRDLMFRLNTFVLLLPPLRERKEDIALLAKNLVDKFSVKYKKSKLKLNDDVVRLLNDYGWPGNVRELSHVIERAVILCRENTIEPSHIMLTDKKAPQDEIDKRALRSLDDVEFDMITHALKKYQGHVSKAASALGISRNALYRRLEKYQLNKEDFEIE
ncbi:sigma-54 dependent transcriptional regulator [Alteromonas stellipolaris]|uniref:sigma-54-dependent transcriptional regulator n=1 Tax=Alteromonas stellipolaris TaxID=233316 RepID=UPI0026E30466|nr:sigma-54 dependent transcriptional regulator [Alteromonas stellipolaris]MDO6537444.1 sigma-54 dependent transcriptional regulator [Alteromonas stellipolaris]MDP2594647.1 sigma-54 dependent transcriptional regulator [Alteromonas stellipolaris]